MTASILVFDGDCGICTASAQWVSRHAPRVEVRSHHQHGVANIDKVWLIEGERRREGADAVAAVLRMADRRAWRLLGHAMAMPVARSLAGIAYWLIARNRTRISRVLGMKACAVPPRPTD